MEKKTIKVRLLEIYFSIYGMGIDSDLPVEERWLGKNSKEFIKENLKLIDEIIKETREDERIRQAKRKENLEKAREVIKQRRLSKIKPKEIEDESKRDQSKRTSNSRDSHTSRRSSGAKLRVNGK